MVNWIQQSVPSSGCGGGPVQSVSTKQRAGREDLPSAGLLSRDIGLLPSDRDSHLLSSRLQAFGLRLDDSWVSSHRHKSRDFSAS